PFGMAEHVGETRELTFVSHAERDHGVRGLIARIRHDARMAVAEAASVAAGSEIARGDVDEHRKRRLVERELDLLAVAGALPRIERREDRVRCEHAGTYVHDRHAVFRRLALGFPAYAHETGFCLQNEIVAGKCCLGAARSVTGDGAAHEARRLAL